MKTVLNTLHTSLVFNRRVRVLADCLASMVPEGASVLDVGCGDGQISKCVMTIKPSVTITGIDVLIRPDTHIPVKQFDGRTIPYADKSVDLVTMVDVLHHTDNPSDILREAARVSKRFILLKDHFRDGLLAGPTLRLMDWVGNFHHGVVLPYNYLSEVEWNRIYAGVGLKPVRIERHVDLYPWPASMVFGRGLHFVALLEVPEGAGLQPLSSASG